LRRGIDASRDERRRISGELHDGVVPDVAATILTIDDLARRAARTGEVVLSRDLRRLAGQVRDPTGAQRSLLSKLYPPTLREEGLARCGTPPRTPGLRQPGSTSDCMMARRCWKSATRESGSTQTTWETAILVISEPE
jgi:hypothetical protein